MSKPSKDASIHNYNGETLRDLQFNLARALDQSPEEVELLHSLVVGAVQSLGPSVRSMSQHDLVQTAYQPSVDAISKSESAAQAIDRVLAKYDLLPSTPAIRIAKDGENSIVGAVVVGLIVGAVIVGAICLVLAATD